MNQDRRTWMVASAAILAGGTLALSQYHSQERENDTQTPIDFTAKARLAGYFPNATLKTQHGSSLRFYDDLLRDQSVIIGFFYTDCERTCPLTMANLITLKNQLRQSGRHDIRFYGITVDPANDTSQALAAYAQHMSFGDDFVFLTGRQEELTLIRRKLGVFHPDPIIDNDRSQHSGLIVIGHEPSGRWVRLPGLVPPKRILRTINRVVPA